MKQAIARNATGSMALVAGLLLTGCAGNSPVQHQAAVGEPAAVSVAVHDGQVVGGPRTPEVSLGRKVTFSVVSDSAGELHVHGYDLRADVEPNKAATIDFVATVPGEFEVELHKNHLRLATLEVR